MAYTLPVFNLLVKRWRFPNTPNAGAADQIDIPAQIYLPSRMEGIEQFPPEAATYEPPIIFRIPKGTVPHSRMDIYSGPSSPPTFYRCTFAEQMHAGFPNEYDAILTHQCDGDGTMGGPY